MLSMELLHMLCYNLPIVEFLPDGRTVHVKSCLPLYNTYPTDQANQFAIQFDP